DPATEMVCRWIVSMERRWRKRLHVFDTSDTTYPLEFSSSVSLSCSVSTGSSLSYRWTNASSEVTASSVGVQLDHGGSTLTILNLTRYDRGPYTCQVSNPVSGGAKSYVLSTGSIVGIAVAVVVVVVAVGALLYYLHANRTGKKKNEFNELNYASISHFKKNQDVGVEMPNPEATIYSECVPCGQKPRASQSLNQSLGLFCDSSARGVRVEWSRDGRRVNRTLHFDSLVPLESGFYHHAVGVVTSGAVEVKPSTNPVRQGGALVLSVSPTTSISSGSWTVGTAVIVNWVGSQQAVFAGYAGRASLDEASGALTLSAVTLADAGLYTVKSADAVVTASATITVLEAVSEVNLTTNRTHFVEFRDPGVFTCSAKGSSPAFVWMNGSSVVAAGDRVQIAVSGSSLTILNVTRWDRGPLTCNGSNGVSTETSQSLSLTVYYGPDHMELRGNGQNITNFLPGSDLNVSCSAQSNPAAQLQWAFQGDVLHATGPVLMLYGISEKHSGLYSCLAYNNVTQMHSNITKSINIDVFFTPQGPGQRRLE
ncbi:hypothetical protein NHX12_001081, partial [Muraenolepis orangiensis]